MEFQNLTPYPTNVLDNDGNVIAETEPDGAVALALGEQLLNVPPPQDNIVYIVLPAVTTASDRGDLIPIELEEAERSYRGNVQVHVCHWPAQPAEPAEPAEPALPANDA